MSSADRRTRLRPTRAETRARLMDSGAELIAERGVLGTTIDEIVARAGLTRGAFYSNFKDRDDFVEAVSDQRVEDSIARNRRALAETDGLNEYMVALRDDDTGVPLYIELMLHAIRNPDRRDVYAQRMHRLRNGLAPVVEQAAIDAGIEGPIHAEKIVTMLLALEDGLTLHRLIDPDRIPASTYFELASMIQAVYIAADRAGWRPDA